MKYLEDLYELCDIISAEIADATEKIKTSGGKLSGSDVEYVDKLTHTLKSIKTTIAMIEAEDDGYSHDSRYMRRGGGYYDGGSSYTRGRGRNARRDSMGRYSSMYYDGEGDIVDKLHDLMAEAPDEKTKAELKKFIAKMEMMA